MPVNKPDLPKFRGIDEVMGSIQLQQPGMAVKSNVQSDQNLKQKHTIIKIPADNAMRPSFILANKILNPKQHRNMNNVIPNSQTFKSGLSNPVKYVKEPSITFMQEVPSVAQIDQLPKLVKVDTYTKGPSITFMEEPSGSKEEIVVNRVENKVKMDKDSEEGGLATPSLTFTSEHHREAVGHSGVEGGPATPSLTFTSEHRESVGHSSVEVGPATPSLTFTSEHREAVGHSGVEGGPATPSLTFTSEHRESVGHSGGFALSDAEISLMLDDMLKNHSKAGGG